MTFNRKNQLSVLEKLFKSNDNKAVIFYSGIDSDLGAVIKEFLNNKDFFYYKATAVSHEEQVRLFVDSINEQLPKLSISDYSYGDALKVMQEAKCEKRVIIIDEFQHTIKYSNELISEILKCVNNKWGNQPVLFILLSTNQFFVEHQLVDKLKENAYELSGLIKLPDLSFTDIVGYFSKYTTQERIITYGILGGKSERIKSFDPTLSLKDNIISNILDKKCFLFSKGINILPSELREHSVYNTILLNIAAGNSKLNDLYRETGYSRAKISVYLSNLSDHGLIEKLDSFDTDGKDNTVKGIYSIKDEFLAFFYRFVMPNLSALNLISEEKFYKTYIEPYLDDFAMVSYRKVCHEYIMLLDKMGKLPIKVVKSGMWHGKVGNIDIVCVDDKGHSLVGLCEFNKDTMTFEDFEWLQFCVKQAKIKGDIYYLFSKNGFDERIHEYASAASNVVLIDTSIL